MARAVKWVGQAAKLIRFELPIGFVDRNRPDLATVKWAAIVISHFITKSRRRGDPVVIRSADGRVRVWFNAAQDRVIGFAIEANYDGGRTFENPLARYRRRISDE